MLNLKVDKSKAKTPFEELLYFRAQKEKAGNFFTWEAHPNKIKTSEITRKRLVNKIKALTKTEEFKDENPCFVPLPVDIV